MPKPISIIRRTPKRRSEKAPLFRLFATTGAGLEDVLAKELSGLRAQNIHVATRGVAFRGDLEMVYKANLWLRTAHRVLLEISNFPASNREALYEGVRSCPWLDHLILPGSIAIDAVTHRSEMDHTQFISQVAKDAIVDQFRDRTGSRPDVNKRNPDLRVNVRLLENRCTLSIDTSAEKLHRRGYRSEIGVEAPLKETLAAGILLKSGYDGTQPLRDPMCGSGTILVEGAMIAKNMPPGILGRRFGFMTHPLFDKRLWQNILGDARAGILPDVEVPIVGSDVSEIAVRAVRSAALGAGVDDIIRIRQADIGDLKEMNSGMLVTNPPYGERLGELEVLADLYRLLGDMLKQRCRGTTSHILTSSKYLAGRIGLKAKKRDILWNGPLECRLLHFDLY